ncbi:hypothetical protein B0H13DRAFT_2382847 [Mycena leptocephala]|nr:hypothetical protein B0H13DRAFT_2382847 [Mycena leptocephala]
MSSSRCFTIDDAAPLLFSLCLDKQFLTAPFHLFREGLLSFLQFCIRLMVHEIMRATTNNFSVKAGIPSLPIAEHGRICDWIQVVMWHLRLVTRSLAVRHELAQAGDISWALVDLTIPGESFQMFQLLAYLCWFTKYTSGYDLPHSLNPQILIPLLKAAGQTIVYTRCEGEFAGYDVDGRLIYPDLLTSPLSLNNLFGPPVTLLPGNLKVLTLPMAITGLFSPSSRPLDDISIEYDELFTRLGFPPA